MLLTRPQRHLHRVDPVEGALGQQERDSQAGRRPCGHRSRPVSYRRGPSGPGGAQPAFRPLRVQGGPSPFVPRPGPWQQILHVPSSEDMSHRNSQTSRLSACPRNPITSSYSSTQVFPPVQRTRGPATLHTQLFQRPSKKVSQEGPASPSSAPVFSQRKLRNQRDADATEEQKPTGGTAHPQ